MAGNLTITYGETRTMRRVTLDWTSDASSGDVSGVTTQELSGIIERVTFIPDAGGTQPSDLYNVTIEDENGIDMLDGDGADLSNSAASIVEPSIAIDDKLELKVDSAGNYKGGTIVLYLR